MSFILFGIGILLSFVAFYKGYTFDDRYPGHGRLDRALKLALGNEASRQDALQQKLRDYLHNQRTALLAAQQEPTQLINAAARKSADLKGAQGNLNNQVNAIQRDYSLVLGNYRKANGAIRATDAPAYFEIVDDLSKDANGQSADGTILELTSFQEDVKTLRDSFKEPLALKIAELQGNSAKILNETFNAFLLDVEQEAKDKISKATPTAFRTN